MTTLKTLSALAPTKEMLVEIAAGRIEGQIAHGRIRKLGDLEMCISRMGRLGQELTKSQRYLSWVIIFALGAIHH